MGSYIVSIDDATIAAFLLAWKIANSYDWWEIIWLHLGMKLILNLFPFKGPDLEATLKAIRSGKVTDEDVGKLMQVFETTGNSLTTYFLSIFTWKSSTSS